MERRKGPKGEPVRGLHGGGFALRLPDDEDPTDEVDVPPFEAPDLRAPEPGVREDSEKAREARVRRGGDDPVNVSRGEERDGRFASTPASRSFTGFVLACPFSTAGRNTAERSEA